MKKKSLGNAFSIIGWAVLSIVSAFVFWFLFKYSQVGDLGSILNIIKFG